jgi:hypothetical protein
MVKRLLAIALILALTMTWHSELLLAETEASQTEAIVQSGEQQSLSSVGGVATGPHAASASLTLDCMQPSHGTSGTNCVVGTITDEPKYSAMWRSHFAAWRNITDRLRAEATSLPLRPPILRS